MRDDQERLRGILKAIDQILTKARQGRNSFDSDDMLQVWVLHHLQAIGEAARCLTEPFRQRHPDRVWSKVRRYAPHSGTPLLRKSTPTLFGRWLRTICQSRVGLSPVFFCESQKTRDFGDFRNTRELPWSGRPSGSRLQQALRRFPTLSV
jgi:hypothetical protein